LERGERILCNQAVISLCFLTCHLSSIYGITLHG
jgi:hypothetical protein